MSARKNRLRRRRVAVRKAGQHLLAAIRGLTDVARSGMALFEVIATLPFEGLAARLDAGIDSARRTLDLAGEEAHLRWRQD